MQRGEIIAVRKEIALYFFFNSDMSVPVKQLGDHV